ncbi:hypothetical protein ACFPRL_22630 [Pseudoclavibacter helvolus]
MPPPPGARASGAVHDPGAREGPVRQRSTSSSISSEARSSA